MIALRYSVWLLLVLGASAGMVSQDWLFVAALLWVVALLLSLGGFEAMAELDRGPLGFAVALLGLVLTATLLYVAGSFAILAYHAAFGEREEAIVTQKTYDEESDLQCRVSLSATEQDLGILYRGGDQCEGWEPGEQIQVSVDPHGWAQTIPVEVLPTSRTGSYVVVGWLVLAVGTTAAAVASNVAARS